MTSLAQKLKAFEKLNDKLLFFLTLVFVALLPFYLSRFALQWTQVHLPLIAHILVLIVFFILLLTGAWMVTGERAERLFKVLYGKGIKWPVLFSIAFLLFSIPCFASLTSTLSDLGRVSFERKFPVVVLRKSRISTCGIFWTRFQV